MSHEKRKREIQYRKEKWEQETERIRREKQGEEKNIGKDQKERHFEALQREIKELVRRRGEKKKM